MKIGIISDIHANKVALDAVLKDMKEVDKLICCGDIVGYGPRPKQCVEKVREICDLCVQGNHDRDIANPER
jgi:predicted phosphodiesterase